MDSSPAMVLLEQLTLAAKHAAELGRWDMVDECYDERACVIAGASLSSDEMTRLLGLDQQVRERALVAKAALDSLLRESSAIRRRLNGLRQGSGAGESRSVFLQA
jgi:hypothetical protein